MILFTGSLLAFTSCATIVSGSKQTVNFKSTPSQATVYINEIEIGTTPIEKKLERKKNYDVMIKLDGYKTYETKISRKFNAWYIGNILFGGVIGLIVDPVTGALYKLTPDQIQAELHEGTAFKTKGDDVFIAVKLEIDPSWEKVGQLSN
ncbi:PEGA domain-containing protein [Chishuiella changwenlii]|nr:PEGA domain-containing protein [Chishuiella changwenlii]